MKMTTLAITVLALALMGGCKEEQEATPSAPEQTAEEQGEEKAAEGEQAKGEEAEGHEEEGHAHEGHGEEGHAHEGGEHAHGEGHHHEGDKGDKVEISKEGTKLDPPVEKAKIPEGAWICDMGTVHYARMEKGDGQCPICKMKLTQHGAGEKEPEPGE